MYHHQLPLSVTQNDMYEFTLAEEKIGLEKYLIMLKNDLKPSIATKVVGNEKETRSSL